MNTQIARAEPSADAEVGRRVHMLMWDRQITQTALAPQLGIEQSALSKKLRGHRGWSVDELITTAAYLRTSVAYLVGEVDDEGPVHPLGLEPRTHCLSVDGEPRGELVSLADVRAARRAGTVRPVA